jgi:hypothetical protein
MSRRQHRVYVIRLKNSVWDKSAKYRKANPQYVHGRPHVYVGSTATTPEQRFEKHKGGGLGTNRFVRRFGKRLMPKEYQHLPTFPERDGVEQLEADIAKALHSRGWGVWYNADSVGPRLMQRRGDESQTG